MAEDEKELKDQRVVTMMTPSELEAIDDWMFKNRIRSRGEAIRRLCQIGMTLDARLPMLLRAVLEANTMRKSGFAELHKVTPSLPPDWQTAAYRSESGSLRATALVMSAVSAAILEVVPLKAPGQLNISLEQARQMKKKLATLDPTNDQDSDEITRMLSTIFKREVDETTDK